MDGFRPTQLIINTNAIKHNIRKIQEKVGNNVTVIPVVKARGYGTGIGTVFPVFEETGINTIAVAAVNEGIGLRSRGFNGDIIVLYQPYIDEIDEILEFNLTVSVCVKEFIELLNKKAQNLNKKAKVHLEIDTGMRRVGIPLDETAIYIELLKRLDNIQLDGIYTHFSSSDDDIEYTKKQIEEFDKAVNIAKQSFENIKYIHACNTAGIINFPEAHYNAVRPGLALYGYLPNEELKEKIDLMPATVLKSKIIYVQEANVGDSVSYNRRYKCTKPTKIATIPIGYADGIMRRYNGKILINDKLADIIGTICMDGLMVDITDIPDAVIGTDAYIWDNEKITIEDIARKCGTINYEILSNIAPRVIKLFT
jgi:alanine racemase